MSAKSPRETGFDRIVHERFRLMILTRLATSPENETGFTDLRDALGMTPGNLSVQLRTLEEAGYILTEKRFVNKKSFTGVRLEPAGRKALETHVGELEAIIKSLKKQK